MYRNALINAYHIGRAWALLKVCLSPISGQCVVNPIGRVCTIHSQWICVMTVNVDGSVGTWCVNPRRPGNIIDKWDPDT